MIDLKSLKPRSTVLARMGPDPPGVLEGWVRSICLRAKTIMDASPLKTLTLDWRVPEGRVRITRMDNQPGPSIDYVWTWITPLVGYIILKDWDSGIIYIYNTMGVKFREIETGNVCPVIDADKNYLYLFCYTDHETVSYYCKFDYSGNLIYGLEFAAGELSGAVGHNLQGVMWDVFTGWDVPGGAAEDENTQYLWLYQDYELVDFVSFPITAETRKYATDVRITDDGIFVTIFDGAKSGEEWTKWESAIYRYDFNMDFVAQTVNVNNITEGSPLPAYPYANEYYATYSYDLGKWIEKVKTKDLAIGETPATSRFLLGFQQENPANYIFQPLGLIDYDYYWWWADMTNQTDGVIVYDIISGAEKQRIKIPPCDWYAVGPISLPYRQPGCVVKEVQF